VLEDSLDEGIMMAIGESEGWFMAYRLDCCLEGFKDVVQAAPVAQFGGQDMLQTVVCYRRGVCHQVKNALIGAKAPLQHLVC
jgi:hypothetical protein